MWGRKSRKSTLIGIAFVHTNVRVGIRGVVNMEYEFKSGVRNGSTWHELSFLAIKELARALTRMYLRRFYRRDAHKTFLQTVSKSILSWKISSPTVQKYFKLRRYRRYDLKLIFYAGDIVAET